MIDNLEAIRFRWGEVEEWTRGRSSHPFEDARDHARNLAKWYVEDVLYLLRTVKLQSQDINNAV